MSNEIVVLLEGYGYTDNDGKYHASGTSTLIKGETMIIVDTGGPWQKQELVSTLKKENVSLEEITVVVGTHGHSDHIGNLNLFPHAKQIVGFDINVNDVYHTHEFKAGLPYVINANVKIMPTPGHTSSDVSVIVSDVCEYGTVGVCGDLFEHGSDHGVWQAVSFDQNLQTKHRKCLLKFCDYIIPGHGKMFKVFN